MKPDFDFLWFIENLSRDYNGWMEQLDFYSTESDMDMFATYFAMSV